MEQSTPSQKPTTGLRPVFLTVLCALTFLNSIYSVYSFTQQYFNTETQVVITNKAINNAVDKMKDDNPSITTRIFSSMKPVTVKNIHISCVIDLISILFTLAGAALMFKLKKEGFIVYIIGSAIIALTPPITLGFGLSGILSMTAIALIGLLFTTLYGLNLTYMPDSV